MQEVNSHASLMQNNLELDRLNVRILTLQLHDKGYTLNLDRKGYNYGPQS